VVKKLYQENDKIMLLATGEVFTVLADLTENSVPGIFVKEKVLPAMCHSQVRPAGRTRERADAGAGITEPDSPPPRPENSIL
jgi:hypothetical protein